MNSPLYNLSYASKFPVPFCSGPYMVNVNGTCTNMKQYASQMRDDAQNSGSCAMLNKPIGGYCVPSNKTWTTPRVGFYGADTQSVQFGPVQQPDGSCFYGGCK